MYIYLILLFYLFNFYLNQIDLLTSLLLSIYFLIIINSSINYFSFEFVIIAIQALLIVHLVILILYIINHSIYYLKTILLMNFIK
jgi:hypothetical protein